MDRSLVLSLFALSENLFTFLMHLTLNNFFRLAPCMRVDLHLLLCQTVVPPPGKVPQHFCEPDGPGLGQRFVLRSGAERVRLRGEAGRSSLVLGSLAALAGRRMEMCGVRPPAGHVGPKRPPSLPWQGGLS